MRSFTLLLAAFVLALAVAASAAAKVTKYRFTDVTFSDGTNGIIYAGVKETNRSILTACNYHSSSSGASLGYYADAFASDDPAAVRQFCLDNFDERNT
jgi:opacity protein-like surface antigen